MTKTGKGFRFHCVAIGLLLTAGGCSHDSRDDECGEAPEEYLVSAWHGLDGPGSEVVVETPRLLLDLGNVARRPVEARVSYVLDTLRRQPEVATLAELRIAPDGKHRVELDLRKVEDQLKDLRFSARVQVFVEPLDVERGTTPDSHHALELYLHPSSDGYHVYGEEVLRKRYRSGDYLGLVDDEVLYEEGAVTQRVAEGGEGEVGPRVVIADAKGGAR